MLHLGGMLEHQARYRGSQTAVVFEDRRLSYADFDELVRRLSGGLAALGLKKGDRLAAALANGVELLSLYWAAARSGIVVVPLSPLLHESGLAKLLRDSGPKLVFVNHLLREMMTHACQDAGGPESDNIIMVGGEAEGFRSFESVLADPGHVSEPPIEGDENDPYNIN